MFGAPSIVGGEVDEGRHSSPLADEVGESEASISRGPVLAGCVQYCNEVALSRHVQ